MEMVGQLYSNKSYQKFLLLIYTYTTIIIISEINFEQGNEQNGIKIRISDRLRITTN